MRDCTGKVTRTQLVKLLGGVRFIPKTFTFWKALYAQGKCFRFAIHLLLWQQDFWNVGEQKKGPTEECRAKGNISCYTVRIECISR